MNPFAYKEAGELADMWQIRAWHAADGRLQRVILAAMIEEYPGVTSTTWAVLYRGLFGERDISRPIAGQAKIMLSGRVVAEVIERGIGNEPFKRAVEIYRDKDEFISDLRRLADKLKLTDAERTEMFTVMRKWIVADYRVGVEGELVE